LWTVSNLPQLFPSFLGAVVILQTIFDRLKEEKEENLVATLQKVFPNIMKFKISGVNKMGQTVQEISNIRG
jgi:hypothetical protein